MKTKGRRKSDNIRDARPEARIKRAFQDVDKAPPMKDHYRRVKKAVKKYF
jgi:hypothetical protein